MTKFSPSLLSADFSNLAQEIKKVESADYLHLDVMDGHFVPNLTFGPGLISDLRDKTDLKFDTHLMMENPEKYIEDFAKAGSDIITVHSEASKHLHRLIQSIKNNGCKAGVALNPATPLSELDYLLNEIDLVLIMSVNPGFGGQSFIPQIKDKISEMAKKKKWVNNKLHIAVDGGVNESNIRDIVEAGADIIVSGSAIFKTSNPSQAMKEMRERIS